MSMFTFLNHKVFVVDDCENYIVALVAPFDEKTEIQMVPFCSTLCCLLISVFLEMFVCDALCAIQED